MNEKELSHIDLFSGIGGFTLAAEWAGFKTIVFCEKEKFCQEVLQKRFGTVITDPDSIKSQKKSGNNEKMCGIQEKKCKSGYSSPVSRRGNKSRRIPIIPEIRDFDGAKYRGATLLTGGFPCQPFSVAGQRRGKEDDRYLWPEMLRVIGEAKPRWILAENVPGIFHMALDTVLSDLESKGYATGTFIIPACGLNAPHRRNRIWIVANSRCQYAEGTEDKGEFKRKIFKKKNAPLPKRSIKDDGFGNASNSEIRRMQRKPISIRPRQSQEATCNIERSSQDAPDSKASFIRGIRNKGKKKRSQDSDELFGGSNRLSWEENWYEVATYLCRMDDGVSDRVHRLKALGNAIVPQIAYEILKNIAWIEKQIN